MASVFIHGFVLVLFAGLVARAFLGTGFAGWSIGLIYIAYDTGLLLFTFWQTLPLARPMAVPVAGRRPSLAVVIAAHNEEAALPATIAALLAQSEPPEEIFIADDGSTDGTASVLERLYGLRTEMGGVAQAGKLRWLRAEKGGKARVLNRVIPYLTAELMVTVDADTILEPGALAAMRGAFAAAPGLVAATGVLTPCCGESISGRVLEFFQTFEYIRNFLGRFAWGRMDALLLISGAFAGFRRDAVVMVGGFDADCLVEDYELIHRLRRYGFDFAMNWHSAVVGGARARTSAPSTIGGFLRQRRRWFGGFLQTQLWYRDMVGARRYGALGMAMLPVKAADTMQPIYGLFAFCLLIFYVVTGRIGILLPVGGIILGKILLDLAFHLWSVRAYGHWAGGRGRAYFGLAILAAVAEPFTFQLLRHAGASLGWVVFLTGRRRWERRA